MKDHKVQNTMFVYPILLSLILIGCASMPIVGKKEAPPLRNLGILSEGEDITVEIIDIIQPGDANSWVKDARWTEICLKVTNKSQRNIEINRIKMLDASGMILDREYSATAMEDFNKQYEKAALKSAVTDQGYSMGLYYLGQISPELVSILTGPLGWLMPIVYQHIQYSIINEPAKVDEEFKKRQIPPVGIASGGSVQGSAFYRYAQFPKKLIVSYTIQDKLKKFEADLSRAISATYTDVHSVKIETDKGKMFISTDPFIRTEISGMDLKKIDIVMSRELTSLELEKFGFGFYPAFPFKAKKVGRGDEKNSVSISEFPEKCLSGISGNYDMTVTGLNVRQRTFYFSVMH